MNHPQPDAADRLQTLDRGLHLGYLRAGQRPGSSEVSPSPTSPEPSYSLSRALDPVPAALFYIPGALFYSVSPKRPAGLVSHAGGC